MACHSRWVLFLWLGGLLGVLLPAVLRAQAPARADTHYLARAMREGTWTLLDTTGSERGGPRFAYIGPFAAGHAVVERGNYEGAINRWGVVTVPTTFDVLEVIYGPGNLQPAPAPVFRVLTAEGWGLMNPAQGRMLLEPGWDFIGHYNDEHLFINRGGEWTWDEAQGDRFTGGKWALVDTAGRQLTELAYDAVWPFEQGHAQVERDGKLGLINAWGQEVVPAAYDEVIPMPPCERGGRQFVRVRTGDAWGWHALDGDAASGDEATVMPQFDGLHWARCATGMIGFRIGQRWGVVSPSGVVLQEPRFRAIAGIDSAQEALIVQDSAGQYRRLEAGGKLEGGHFQGFIQPRGHAPVLSHSRFDEAGPLRFGLIAFRRGNDWGLMDTAGIVRVRAQFHFAEGAMPNRARVMRAGLWGVIDGGGAEVIPRQYKDLQVAGTSFFRALTDSGWVLFDRRGELAFPPGEGSVTEMTGDLILFQRRGEGSGQIELGLADTSGHVLIAPSYSGFERLDSLRWLVYRDGRAGVYDLRADSLVQPPRFDEVRLGAGRGGVLVREGERWGLLGRGGQLLLTPTFERMERLGSGRILGQKRGKAALLGRQGQRLTPFQFEDIRPFEHGVAAARLDDQWGLIGRRGNWRARPRYELIDSFEAVPPR